MTGQNQPARGRGIQSGHDVGEADRASWGRRLEGVEVDGPAGRQGAQGGGDVLKQKRVLIKEYIMCL